MIWLPVNYGVARLVISLAFAKRGEQNNYLKLELPMCSDVFIKYRQGRRNISLSKPRLLLQWLSPSSFQFWPQRSKWRWGVTCLLNLTIKISPISGVSNLNKKIWNDIFRLKALLVMVNKVFISTARWSLWTWGSLPRMKSDLGSGKLRCQLPYESFRLWLDLHSASSSPIWPILFVEDTVLHPKAHLWKATIIKK